MKLKENRVFCHQKPYFTSNGVKLSNLNDETFCLSVPHKEIIQNGHKRSQFIADFSAVSVSF